MPPLRETLIAGADHRRAHHVSNSAMSIITLLTQIFLSRLDSISGQLSAYRRYSMDSMLGTDLVNLPPSFVSP